MGNEASRPVGDELSPQGGVSGYVRSSPNMPPTPTFTPTAGAGRRSKSFTGFQSPSPSSASAAGNVGGVGVAASPSSAANLQKQQSMPRMERTIQRMDKAIRRRVRGGITYNMKIIIRGDKGTGKTSLFQRLKGEPIPDEHVSTPQLQSATINWNFRANSEENVKCEVWDVVDRGFNPLVEGSEAAANGAGANSADHNGSPFELGALQANGGNFASVRASAAVAASIAGATGVNGAHTVATVDASTVDVYHETHGVIFLLDITKWHTLEYVKKELEKVPVHIPTLVLGNFRDCGNQRKIFKEDIQDLLYGSSDRSRQQQQGRRPHELLYFECSLLNCYGLKSLHQYFGVPFLQLKLATIRQQMRIVEGEFSHLKHDLTAKISEQRYSDYVEHIKATGSDIRTGRKVSGTAATGLVRMESTAIVVNGSERNLRVESDDTQNAAAHAKLGRTQSNASTGSDIVVTEQSVASSHVDAPSGTTSPSELSLSQSQQKDLVDLPERTNSLADQVTVPLKIAHAESAPVDPTPMEQEEERPAVSEKTNKTAKSSSKNSTASKESTAKAVNDSPVRTAQKVAVDEPMSLEDFQVPKLKKNDLDSFYSDEDSDADGASDEDVIVPPATGAMKKYTSHSHKQMFIDSDASDSDEEVKSQRNAKKSSPRTREVVAQPDKEPPVAPTKSPSALDQDAEAARNAKPVADAEGEVVSTEKHTDHPSTDESRPEHHQPQPSPSPSTTVSSSRPVSPLQRTSRSPSPRHKLDSSRSNISKLDSSPVLSTDDTTEVHARENTEGMAEDTKNATSIDGEVAVEKAVLVSSAPGSPAGRNSPCRHLQRKESSQSNSSRKNSFEVDSAAEVPVEVVALAETMSNGVLDEHTHEETETSEDVLSETKGNEIKMSTDEAAVENEEKDENSSSRISEDLKYEEEAEHAVLSDDIEDFFSDEDRDKDEAVEVSSSQAQNERPAESSTVTLEQKVKRPELIVSDDEDDEPKLTVASQSQANTNAIAVEENGASKERFAADEAGEDVHDLVVGSTMDNDKFFSDESDADDEETQNVETQVPISTPSVTSVQSKTAQQSSRPSMLMNDEESEDDGAQIPARNSISVPLTAAPPESKRRLDIAMNGESSDSNDDRHVQKARNIPVFSSHSSSKVKESSTSYLPAPAEAGYALTTSKNELDSFFSESESESEDIRKPGNARNLNPTSPSRAKTSNGPSRYSLVASDDDGDEDGSTIDRFASYSTKTVRKSKAERKQEREEIRRMTASLSSSALIEDATPAPTTLASIGNADVMAAIRQAQEEALRMMPMSDNASGGEDDKKRIHKSKSKSSSSSSHRRSSKTHGENLTASSSSSRTTKKKKSSSSKSSLRSSSKREAGSGDERRESRR
ncbi:hypothetical protein FI667_g2875, partial [Globisporangium splendens]